MINIILQNEKIDLTGHANYAPIGKDIVCASISILVQNLITSIEVLSSDNITYEMSDGKTIIEFKGLSEISQTLIRSFYIGCKMVALEYPLHIQIDQNMKSLKALDNLI